MSHLTRQERHVIQLLLMGLQTKRNCGASFYNA